jgi:hypothetical protein
MNADVRTVLRRIVPRPVRHGASVQIARLRSRQLRRRLSALAADRRPIVAGPWLGEVGFELLYWIPFLRWFAEEFEIDPGRLVIVSRGGTWSWYSPFATRYREIFDYVGPEEFRRSHDDRVERNGEQKQTVETPFERELLERIARRTGSREFVRLHPASMYEVMNPFWWHHLDESWVHRHTHYRRLSLTDRQDAGSLPPTYIAVKFYFNDCFPATDGNRALVRRIVRQLAEEAPVVSLTTGLSIDDHGGVDLDGHGVTTLPLHLDPRRNLHVQSAIVAGASAFVGTYGGFSYLAPFFGVHSTGYFANPAGYSPRHLAMARSAFAAIGTRDLLELRDVNHSTAIARHA